jgi:hypothetical protein
LRHESNYETQDLDEAKKEEQGIPERKSQKTSLHREQMLPQRQRLEHSAEPSSTAMYYGLD